MIVAQNGKKIFPEELEYYIEKKLACLRKALSLKKRRRREHIDLRVRLSGKRSNQSVIEKTAVNIRRGG